MLRELRTNKALYLLAVPGLLYLIVFAYVPMLGHLIAFKRFNINQGLWGSDWAGFANFKFFFMGKDWIAITVNTLFLNSLFIVFGLGLALALALALNEIRSVLFKRISQSFFFMPYFISWVVVGLMTTAILGTTDGLANQFLKLIGQEPVSWYSTPGVWPALLTLVYVWKQAGYFCIIFLAAIASLSSDYYESARMDGATRLQQIIHITLPLIRPTLIILTLLAVGRIFYGDFGMIYGIVGDNGVLFATTDVIDTYTYRSLRQMGNFSMSSAIVLYQSFLGLITIVLFNWLAQKIDKDSALF